MVKPLPMARRLLERLLLDGSSAMEAREGCEAECSSREGCETDIEWKQMGERTGKGKQNRKAPKESWQDS